MGRGLLSLGSLLLVVTVALWIAGAADWMPPSEADPLSSMLLRGSLVLLAAWLVLRIVSPVTRKMGKGRCTVCGAAIERGYTYCLDHLQETVHSTRDRTRERTLSHPKPRG